MTPRVLVTHPGRQHSHQTALGLHAAGMLAGYWAGVPALERHALRLPRWLWSRFVRYEPVPLPAALVRCPAWVPALRRLGDLLLPRGAAAWLDFAACRLFDRWAARRLASIPCEAVIACEISALTSFRAARRLGRLTILDAPSVHHSAQDRLHGFSEPQALHRRLVAVKDAEIALADHIFTVSELARDSYLEAGAPSERVHSLALGVDLDLFRPREAPGDSAPGVRFLFSGASIRRKGFDILVEAFARVTQEDPGARLHLVGPHGETAGEIRKLPPERIRVTGPLPQRELARRLAEVDCLVLPSREDSFGLVVAEALACGTPVIVSDQVGAKELVVPDVTGWVVPAGDAELLAERMLWCVRNLERLRCMRGDCRRAAARAGWERHHQRLAALIASVVGPVR